MPISQFSKGLQNVISLLPGTYGTSLFRNHSMRGALDALNKNGVPENSIELIKDGIDCNIYFFDTQVSIPAMFAVVCITVALLVTAYVIINVTLGGKAKKA